MNQNFQACRDHAKGEGGKSTCAVCKRLKVENSITKKIVSSLIKAGYELSVFDGEETTVRRSTKVTEVHNALGTTDEDFLYCYKNETVATILFVYGNDGWDTPADWNSSLDSIVEPIVDTYCNR